MNLSARARSLKPSPTLLLASKAKELTAAGHKVVSLSVGEPDWDTFEVAKEAARKAIQDGLTKYTPANGIPELRKAIASQVSKDLDLNYDFNQVTVSAGGKFIIFSALQTLLDAGDEVIIPAPFWVSYPTMVELAEGKPVLVVCDSESNFKLNPAQLEKAITKKTKLLFLNSPSNPTGAIYSAKELSALAAVLRKHPNIYILSDDIYNRLVFDQEVAPHILNVAPDLKERVLVVNGAAKSFSMTGWRVGWALGDSEWIKAMTNYQSQSVSCATSIAQYATLAAVTDGQPELKKSIIELKRRRDFAAKLFSTIPGFEVPLPDGAFYLWCSIKSLLGKSFNGQKLNNSSDFAAALLEDQKVVAVPGIEFGLDGYLRVSYALKDDQIQLAADRIKSFVAKL